MSEYFYVADVTYISLQRKQCTKTVSNVIANSVSASEAFTDAKNDAISFVPNCKRGEPTVVITRFCKID